MHAIQLRTLAILLLLFSVGCTAVEADPGEYEVDEDALCIEQHLLPACRVQVDVFGECVVLDAEDGMVCVDGSGNVGVCDSGKCSLPLLGFDEVCDGIDNDCDGVVDEGCVPVTDFCADSGWYGDGICDEGCLNPDPDCTGSTGGSDGSGGSGGTSTLDYCEVQGWYGDGICDVDCPKPDPDC